MQSQPELSRKLASVRLSENVQRISSQPRMVLVKAVQEHHHVARHLVDVCGEE